MKNDKYIQEKAFDLFKALWENNSPGLDMEFDDGTKMRVVIYNDKSSLFDVLKNAKFEAEGEKI